MASGCSRCRWGLGIVLCAIPSEQQLDFKAAHFLCFTLTYPLPLLLKKEKKMKEQIGTSHAQEGICHSHQPG
jgi:hypothetical protein